MKGKQQQDFRVEKYIRYGIRKYSFGAASVAIAAGLMFLGNGAVSANETKQVDETAITVKQATDLTDKIEDKKDQAPVQKEAEVKKATEEKRKSSSSDIGEKFVTMTSTHYENEYFIVDVPEKWSGKWSISKTIDTKNLGTPSQPAITYMFSRSGDNPMFGGGGQTVHVYPNGLPSKANSVKEWTKFGSNIYVGVGASSGFFNEKNETYYKEEMAKIRAK